MTSVPAYAGTWKTRQANAPTLQIWDGSGFVSYWYVAPECSGLAENAWVQNTKADVGATVAQTRVMAIKMGKSFLSHIWGK